MKNSRRWRIAIFCLFAVFLWDLQRFVSEIFLLPNESEASVDLVAVLTGGKGRLAEALNSFKDGKGQYLLISGTGEGSSLSDILRVNNIEEFPDTLRDRVIIDANSLSTTDNVREILKIVEEKKLRSIKIITSNYHLPRTMKLMDLEISGRSTDLHYLKIYQLPVESPNFPSDRWWASPLAWRILFSEYFKDRVIFW